MAKREASPGKRGLRALAARWRRPAAPRPERYDFDQLARDLASGLSRREALRRLGLGLVAGLLSAFGVGAAEAATGCPPGNSFPFWKGGSE
jgi:hypothetical protein